MTEKIKLALLAGILGTLLWTAAHPKPQVGRFTTPTGDAGDQIFDSATGRACVGWAHEVVPGSGKPAGQGCPDFK